MCVCGVQAGVVVVSKGAILLPILMIALHDSSILGAEGPTNKSFK